MIQYGIKNCSICNSSKISFFARSKHTHHPNRLSKLKSIRSGDYLRCNNCGLIFQFPIPQPKKMISIYDSRGYYSFFREELFEKYLREKADKNSQNQQRLKLIKKYTSPDLPKSFIDIGCGYSILVKLATEEGWDAMGIEPSLEWAEAAKKILHPIQIFNGYINDYLRRERKRIFSAIGLFDVIEHVNDPFDLLNNIKKL